jgi:ADP-ribose pyrophosphatase YjhB (NUDIX family)
MLIAKHLSQTVAIEMEGLGFLRTTNTRPSCVSIVIRGISDLLSKKSTTDTLGWPELVCESATSFAFELLDLVTPSDLPRTRFALPGPPSGQTLTVAIGLVVKDGRVVLVRRRQPEGRLEWQFPAGFVKPGQTPEATVVAEIRKETGLSCRIEQSLGTRLHPVTNVNCTYFACRYLHGELTNGDPEENSEADWVAISDIERYIDIDMIFEPLLMKMQTNENGNE